MYQLFKNILLRILKVPPEPLDPMGEVSMLKVFQPGRGYFRYGLMTLVIGQLILWAVVLTFCGVLVFVSKMPQPLGWIISGVALMLLIVQTFLGYSMLRLDYEMRWYKVTDRSLRIREGIMHVREMTMTFANIQNLTISQGPLQKLFGIADLKVQSAGGGGGGAQVGNPQHGTAFDAHTAYFRGVDNASEIRDLMLDRLKHLKDVGLGDQDDARAKPEALAVSPTTTMGSSEVLALLLEINVEAKLLNAAARR